VGKNGVQGSPVEGTRGGEGGTVADRLLRDMRTRLLKVPDFGRESSSGMEEGGGVVDERVTGGESSSSAINGDGGQGARVGGEGEEQESCAKDFNANVGDAIRTLRVDLPKMLEEDLTYDIYTEDIVLWDNWNAIVGIQNYAAIFKLLRLTSRILFSSSTVDVLRLYQPTPRTLEVRWTICAKYHLVPWVGAVWLDYRSVYKFDSRGRIYEHRIDNLVPNGPSQRVRIQSALQALQHVRPTPSYFCETSD